MTSAVFAVLALLARTAIADRGNAALELTGGAHMKVVKSHRAQDMSEIKDQLRELQKRVDKLEAAQVGEAQAHQSVGCHCAERKIKAYLGNGAASVTVAVTAAGVNVLSANVEEAAALGSAGAALSEAFVKHAAALGKTHPCLTERAAREAASKELADAITAELTGALDADVAETSAALKAAQSAQVEEDECAEAPAQVQQEKKPAAETEAVEQEVGEGVREGGLLQAASAARVSERTGSNYTEQDHGGSNLALAEGSDVVPPGYTWCRDIALGLSGSPVNFASSDCMGKCNNWLGRPHQLKVGSTKYDCVCTPSETVVSTTWYKCLAATR
jgi:hypothetical protein